MSDSRMGPKEVVSIARQILERPVKPPPGTEATADSDAAERMILMVAAFLSLDSQELQGVIYAEAQNRVMIGKTIGRMPWEIGT